MNLKFSFIIPIHHEYGAVTRCLDSIFNQTYKNFEVICVLDNASDTIETLLKDYPVTYYKVNYNRPGLTRNEGLKHATGDFIGFVDCDDNLVNEYVLEKINNQLDLSIDEFVWHNNEGGDPTLMECLVGTRIYRREFLKEHDIWFPNALYDEDVNFLQLIRAILHRRIDVYNKEPYYQYHGLNPGSITWNRHFGRAIWFSLSGCGKTYAAHQSTHGLDLEAGVFRQYNAFNLFCTFICQEVTVNHFCVFTNCEEELMDLFDLYNIPVNIILPSRDMKDEILERIRVRDGENCDGYHIFSEEYEKIYDKFANRPNANIFFLQSGEYISTYLSQLDQMNVNVGKEH